MRKNISIAFSILAFIAVLTLLLDYKIRPEVKTLQDISTQAETPLYQAPDFAFADIYKRTGALKKFRGKIVILHFWATWCPPCLTEFPKLVRTSKDYKNDLILLAVSSDDRESEIRKFTAANSISVSRTPNIYMIWDPDRTLTHDLFQTYAYPETIVINGTGRMVRKIPGDADWTAPEMTSYLKTLTGTLAKDAQRP